MTTSISTLSQVITALNNNEPNFSNDSDKVCVRIHGLGGRDFWIEADEYADNGGLSGYLDSLDVDSELVSQITNHDWENVDWEGDLLNHFVNPYGFDIDGYTEARDADLDAEVISAGLEAGIPVESISDAYCGQWESDEDYAQEVAEQGQSIPENLWGYIDWERYARDVMMDMYAVRGHYFSMAY
ncbi:TPA: antirestriction protein ArdA [Photobacterium damselae]